MSSDTVLKYFFFLVSDVLVKDLAHSGVHKSLTGLTARKDISDLDELVTKLSTALNTA